MAKQKANTQFLQRIANNYAMSLQSSECADIITFTRADWGLNFSLSPVQEFILRVFYGLELDNEYKIIDVPDDTGSKIIGEFTQREFLDYLIDEGKVNIKEYIPGHQFKELILCLGRRSGKCNYSNSPILTTCGTITYKELHEKINSGEKIGIITYDLNKGKQYISYNLKSEYNGIKKVFEIKTSSGKTEIATQNHPFLVLDKDNNCIRWEKLNKLKIGDYIAVSKCLPVFGKESIGLDNAKKIGKLFGSHNKKYISSDLKEIIKKFNIYKFLKKNKIPDIIKNLRKEELSVFIKELLSCKGIFSDDIYFFSKSEIFVKELQIELIKFGIQSKIKKIKKGKIKLIVNKSDFSQKFYDSNLENKKTTENKNNIYWEKIIEINEIGYKETIALEVSDTNIIGNCIISHNSVLSSIISTYETYRLVKMGNPQAHFGFPSGQQISVTLVSTTEEQSQTMFDMVRTRGSDCTYLKDRILHTTQTYFDVLTDDDKEKNRPKGSVKLQSGGSSSAALRGSNNIVVIFDEAAFFQDGMGRSSGGEVYKALTPSILTFGEEGKILLLSSPNGKSGLFYDKYKESFDDTDRILMFQLYSALANPLVSSSFLRSEKRRDRKAFDCEYGANFLDTLSAWIDDVQLFEKCINRERIGNTLKGKSGVEYFWGIDLGLKNDGTAITICHREDEKIIIDYSNVWFSASSDIWESNNKLYKDYSDKSLSSYNDLPMSEIVNIIKKLSENFPIADGWFDQYNGQALYEMLTNEGYKQFRMVSVSSGLNMQTFQTCKNLYTSELIEFPNNELLLSELLSLEETRNGGVFKVEAPKRQGFHDDISVSCVRAIYACYNAKLKKKINAITLSNKESNMDYMRYRYEKALKHGVVESRLAGRSVNLRRFLGK